MHRFVTEIVYMLNTLNQLFPGQVFVPNTKENIPNGVYMVYILAHNNTAIVAGHGKKNRASVIFDDVNTITNNHYKALTVRLYHLFGNGDFSRFIIECEDKADAKAKESIIHQQIGGNDGIIPNPILNQLFNGIPQGSFANLFLKLALLSSFDGLSDLRKWRNAGLFDNPTWTQVKNRLQLPWP